MKTIEVTRVEDWDGGDRHNFVCHIEASVPVEQLKKRWPNGSFSKTVLVVFDSVAEVEENTNLKLRQRVWDKLTAAERQAINMLERPTK
jgi:hypothetical protein